MKEKFEDLKLRLSAAWDVLTAESFLTACRRGDVISIGHQGTNEGVTSCGTAAMIVIARDASPATDEEGLKKFFDDGVAMAMSEFRKLKEEESGGEQDEEAEQE